MGNEWPWRNPGEHGKMSPPWQTRSGCHGCGGTWLLQRLVFFVVTSLNRGIFHGIDGDHPTQPILDQVTALSHVQRSSIAKEVQILVRNGLVHSDSEDGHSFGNWPGFVWLAELDPREVISCTHSPLKA